jgi:riboflavin transporter FmnP
VALTITSTGGVGELSNFLLGVALVLPAGLIYRKLKTRKGALIGSFVGLILMALVWSGVLGTPLSTAIRWVYMHLFPLAQGACNLVFKLFYQ